MSDHTLPVKYQLRYDTYNNWIVSPTILLPGEVGIAIYPSVTAGNPPRAVGIKIGDGLHYFDELPWIQAVASDVYNWAKSVNKPNYSATEIDGLAEYIASHTGGGGSSGGGGEAAGAYRISYDSASSKYILQYYDEAEDEWRAATGDEINLSGLLNRLNTIERWANGAKTQLGNIELPITAIVYDEVVTYINRLNVEDSAVEHRFVTAVEQVNGKIRVTRSILSASDITTGVLGSAQGGTGLTYVDSDKVLVGSNDGTVTTKTFVTEIDPTDRASFATAGAIIDYVALMTAGLTGAMHFIGETSIVISNTINNHADPQIAGYNFRNAQSGDVILANGSQEYVWTGSEWRLLGDEGSYAIKGSIVNADIHENAAIAISKIDGLSEALAAKVDKVEGKGLSTNDYTTEEKNKLRDIEDGAQENVIEHILVNDVETSPTTIGGQPKSVNLVIPVLSEEDISKLEGIESGAQENIIEHVFVNGTEIQPSTINELPKSVGINFIPFTQQDQEKLNGIEAEAQVNSIEEITINNVSYTPDANKNIDITIDFAELKSNTEDYWNLHPIIPGSGELIIYTVDGNHSYPRLKVGDGVTLVTALPFIDAGSINGSSAIINSYENKNAFPNQGENKAIYLDLSTGSMYYYINNEYKQLFNNPEKVPVSSINSWLVGKKPSFVCEGGRLKISTGILPSLSYDTWYVIRNLTKEVSQ